MSKENGQGMAATNAATATLTGRAAYSPTPVTDGEFGGVGSSYAATLRERENKSNTRNKGPSRDGGPIGDRSIQNVSMSARRTGRIGTGG